MKNKKSPNEKSTVEIQLNNFEKFHGNYPPKKSEEDDQINFSRFIGRVDQRNRFREILNTTESRGTNSGDTILNYYLSYKF